MTDENIDTRIEQETNENKEIVTENLEKVQENKTEDPNWKAFREARKKDRAEKEAALRRAAEKEAEAAALKAAMEAAFAKENNNLARKNTYYDDDHEEETEDQRIEKKVQAALALREEQYKRERDLQEQQMYPQRLAQTYPDFHGTVTEENLDYLEYHYPEIARPLKRQQEGYDKWSDIYLAVKKLVPNALNAKKDAARAEANFAKPRSISYTTTTQQTASSHILSDAQKAANWERMQRTLKSAS